MAVCSSLSPVCAQWEVTDLAIHLRHGMRLLARHPQWHGLQDKLVPAEHAWQLVSSLPDCRPAFDPDEGHVFFRRRVDEIVRQLVDAARPAPNRQRPAR